MLSFDHFDRDPLISDLAETKGSLPRYRSLAALSRPPPSQPSTRRGVRKPQLGPMAHRDAPIAHRAAGFRFGDRGAALELARLGADIVVAELDRAHRG